MKNQLLIIGIVFIAITYLSSSCKERPSITVENSELLLELNNKAPEVIQKDYSELMNRVSVKQKLFTIEYPSSNPEHKKGLIALSHNYIYETLCDSIFPYWYGTKWDFNGTTTTPRQGKIACGYFVSTTLQHIGYNINRVTIAQQAASHIITTLCGKGKTKVIGHSDVKKLRAYLHTQKDGIFILGLDNHVGFIQKADTNLYFIHSSGIQTQLKVLKERVSESVAIRYSKAYYIGDLLSNDNNTEKWIKNEKITLIK